MAGAQTTTTGSKTGTAAMAMATGAFQKARTERAALEACLGRSEQRARNAKVARFKEMLHKTWETRTQRCQGDWLILCFVEDLIERHDNQRWIKGTLDDTTNRMQCMRVYHHDRVMAAVRAVRNGDEETFQKILDAVVADPAHFVRQFPNWP